MLRRLSTAVLLVPGLALRLAAQAPPAVAPASTLVFAGSATEDYYRTLRAAGLSGDEPWSIRPFSRTQAGRITSVAGTHPRAMTAAAGRSTRWRGIEVEFVPLELRAWYNSAFPFGDNDGAVWVGRGATASAFGGVSASWGPVRVTVAPTAFWAQNQRFTLLENGETGSLKYGDLFVKVVDRPQRFGDSRYARLDAGQSAISLEGLGLTVGASNADQWWGPMSQYPFILGNNAGGLKHIFFGSSRALNAYVGKVSWRVIYADIPQSPFSATVISGGRRFASGGIAVFQPRFIPGLEVGAARFFHVPWPDSGLNSDYFSHIFESLLKDRISKVLARASEDPNQSADNQLASVFFRWNPGSGFEVYGEYGREDHNWDMRDLIAEPDHSAAVGLGLRKSWWSGPDALNTVLVESMNFDASTLWRHRAEGGIYIHSFTKQGHTQRGQLLGTAFAVGSGAGFTTRVERIRPTGTSSVSVQVNRFALTVFDTAQSVDASVRIHRSIVLGRRELGVGLTTVYEFNRHLRGDAMNWGLDIGMRYRISARRHRDPAQE